MPTDLHCHLLPALDDGPPTLEESVALARALVAGGVSTAVATPHVNHRYPNTPATIAAAAAGLRETLRDAKVGLQVVAGAEVSASAVVDIDAATLRELALGGGDWLLLEPPLQAEFAFERAAERVREAGLGVVVAHPERCRLFQQAPDRLSALVAGGARLSITAGSLRGQFGRPARELAWRLVDEDVVANVTSDAHDTRRRRPTLLADLTAAGLRGRSTQWCEDFCTTVLGPLALPVEPATGSGTPAPQAVAAEPARPVEFASAMVARGSSPADVERYLSSHLPPSIVRRQVRRLLREHGIT